MMLDTQQNFLVQVIHLLKKQQLLFYFYFSLAAHNFEKVEPLEVYNKINKFDIICVSESYLASTFSSNNDDINIKGYKLVRANHPKNTKEVVFVRTKPSVRVVPNHFRA